MESDRHALAQTEARKFRAFLKKKSHRRGAESAENAKGIMKTKIKKEHLNAMVLLVFF